MAQDYKTTHTVNGKEVKDALKPASKASNDPRTFDAEAILGEQERRDAAVREIQQLMDLRTKQLKQEELKAKMAREEQKERERKQDRQAAVGPLADTTRLGPMEILNYDAPTSLPPVTPDELFRVLGENRARVRDRGVTSQNPDFVGQVNDLEASIIPQLEAMGYTRAEINTNLIPYQLNEATAISGSEPNLWQSIFGITPKDMDPKQLSVQMTALGVDQKTIQLMNDAFALRAQASTTKPKTAGQLQIENDMVVGKAQASQLFGQAMTNQAKTLWDGIYNGQRIPGGGFGVAAATMEAISSYLNEGSAGSLAKARDLENSLKANMDSFVLTLSEMKGELLDPSDIDLVQQQLFDAFNESASLGIDPKTKRPMSDLMGNFNATSSNMMLGRKAAYDLGAQYVSHLRAALARSRNRWEMRQKQKQEEAKQKREESYKNKPFPGFRYFGTGPV